MREKKRVLGWQPQQQNKINIKQDLKYSQTIMPIVVGIIVVMATCVSAHLLNTIQLPLYNTIPKNNSNKPPPITNNKYVAVTILPSTELYQHTVQWYIYMHIEININNTFFVRFYTPAYFYKKNGYSSCTSILFDVLYV